MENEKLILFSDYVRDKNALRDDINKLLVEFLDKYPVYIQEIPINFIPSFGDVPQKYDGVEIIVR